ncbi:MAG: hypothetical protein JWO88_2841 [Frankiales bacterium]|nr:hypothetical protein [Frankiales bacterium]
MTEPLWLSEVRARVHTDQDLLRRLVLISDTDAFVQAVIALPASPVTADAVSQAMREAHRLWLERWIS